MHDRFQQGRIEKFVGQYNRELSLTEGAEQYIQPLTLEGVRWVISVVARESIDDDGTILDEPMLDAASQSALRIIEGSSPADIARERVAGLRGARFYSQSMLLSALRQTATNGADSVKRHIGAENTHRTIYVSTEEAERLEQLSIRDVILTRLESEEITPTEAAAYLAVFGQTSPEDNEADIQKAKYIGTRALEAKMDAAQRWVNPRDRIATPLVNKIVGCRRDGRRGMSVQEVVDYVSKTTVVAGGEHMIIAQIANELGRLLDYAPAARYHYR